MRLTFTTIAAAVGIVTTVGIAAAPAEARPHRHGGYGYHHGYARPYHHGHYRDRHWRNHHRGYIRHHYRGYRHGYYGHHR